MADQELSPLLADAIALACRVHREQTDKAGAPYILHPLRVMSKVEGTDLQMVAILHDVLEDSDGAVTTETLYEMGFPEDVVMAVDTLSKRAGENYQDFILRVSNNFKASKVKLADLEDNMDLRRLKEVTEKDLKRFKKYHEAHQLLSKVTG